MNPSTRHAWEHECFDYFSRHIRMSCLQVHSIQNAINNSSCITSSRHESLQSTCLKENYTYIPVDTTWTDLIRKHSSRHVYMRNIQRYPSRQYTNEDMVRICSSRHAYIKTLQRYSSRQYLNNELVWIHSSRHTCIKTLQRYSSRLYHKWRLGMYIPIDIKRYGLLF